MRYIIRSIKELPYRFIRWILRNTQGRNNPSGRSMSEKDIPGRNYSRIHKAWKSHIGKEGICFFFLVSVLVGMYLGTKCPAFLFDKESFYRCFRDIGGEGGLNFEEIFSVVLWRRVGQLFLFFLLLLWCNGIIIFGGYLFLWGIGLGIYFGNLVVNYSFQGMVMFFISLFPQLLFYVPVTLFLINFAWSYLTKRKKSGRIGDVFWTMLLGVAGICVESYLNPLFIEWITG